MSSKKKTKEKSKKTRSPKKYVVDNYEEKIAFILDRFRFNRVQLTMRALNWKWPTASINGDEYPSIERMRATARYLLTKVATEKDCLCATGGFHALRYDDGCLQLSFEVESYQSDPY